MAIDVDEPPQDLVRVTVQADWNDVVRDVAAGRAPRDRFWVSCYRTGCPSVHSGVLVAPPTPPAARETREPPQQQQRAAVALTAESDLRAEWVDSASFALACPVLASDGVLVRAPRSSFPKPVSGPANSLDVSPQGQLLVVGGDEGQLRLLDAKDGRVRLELKGHVGDIRTCRFFPSGQVVLSGSTDMQLRIFSALDGICARVLKGHSGAVSDTAIVDKGRNILSCSRDGTVKLWECASGSTLRTVVKSAAPVNRIALSVPPEGTLPPEEKDDETAEVGTSGKLLFVAGEDGTFRGVHLKSSAEIFSFQLGSPVTSCAVSPSGVRAAAATSDGLGIIVGIGVHPKIVAKFRRGGAAVNDMAFAEDDRLLLASADGCCTTVGIAGEDGVKVLEEFTGPDVDPLYAVCVGAGTTGNRKFVWNTGRDNVIRRY